MLEIWRSLREYAVLVTKAWWQLAIGIAAAGYAVITQLKSGLAVPTWAAVVVALVALFVAQFDAFHRVRKTRDQLSPAVEPWPALPGFVNEFSGGRYWPSQSGQRLQHDEDALTIRAVIGPRQLARGRLITSELRESLRRALQSSPLQQWLLQRTGVELGWDVKSPAKPYLATLVRAASWDKSGPATLTGFCQFQLPTGPQSPRACLFIDVEVRAEHSNDNPDRFRFSLDEIHELLHVLISSAMDRVKPAIFPAVSPHRRRFSLAREEPPIGPSIFLFANGQTSLADFINLSHLHQASGATHVTDMASIETPFEQQLASFDSRDELIRNGLKAALSSSEFLDAEQAIDRLRRVSP